MNNSMHRGDITKWWMILSGVTMVVMGGRACVDSNLVGTRPDTVLAMTPIHGAAHLVVGVVTIGIGFVLSGHTRTAATLLTGVAWLIQQSRVCLARSDSRDLSYTRRDVSSSGS